MKVLIIEDEQKVAKALQQGLEEHQMSCELAFDGQIGKLLGHLALRAFARSRSAVVVVQVMVRAVLRSRRLHASCAL
ncbi:MAG: hypothetical protein AAF223_15125, partial [Bacteroidota bacterium]